MPEENPLLSRLPRLPCSSEGSLSKEFMGPLGISRGLVAGEVRLWYTFREDKEGLGAACCRVGGVD